MAPNPINIEVAAKSPPLRTGRGGADMATVIGLTGGFALIALAVFFGGSATAFVDLPSVLIVIGGTFAVTVASFSFAEIGGARRAVMQTLRQPVGSPQETALLVLRLAESARKKGVLALQPVVAQLRDEEFLAKGLLMVMDGVSEAQIQELMQRELHAIALRHAQGASVLRRASEVAPAMGLIGTLVGLVQMLGNLNDPGSIGPSMAIALLTTFYGAVLANMVFSPLASKLERNALEERLVHQIHVMSATSIARQENPRRLEMLINAILPPAQRVSYFK